MHKTGITIVPAYGRDYKTSADAVAAWNEGKDFKIQSIGHRHDGAYCSIRDGLVVTIRFNRLMRMVNP